MNKPTPEEFAAGAKVLRYLRWEFREEVKTWSFWQTLWGGYTGRRVIELMEWLAEDCEEEAQ